MNWVDPFPQVMLWEKLLWMQWRIVKLLGDKNSINRDAAFVDLPMASRLLLPAVWTMINFVVSVFATKVDISKNFHFLPRLYFHESLRFALLLATLFYECVKALSKNRKRDIFTFSCCYLFSLNTNKFTPPRDPRFDKQFRRKKSFCRHDVCFRLRSSCFLVFIFYRTKPFTFSCCFSFNIGCRRIFTHFLSCLWRKLFSVALENNKSRWEKFVLILMRNFFISSLKVPSAIVRHFISHVHLPTLSLDKLKSFAIERFQEKT